MMACGRDFGGGYESCKHWLNPLIPLQGQYEVFSSGIGRTLRASKDVPVSFSILPVSTEMLSSWCCGASPLTANSHWSRCRATWTLGIILTRFSTCRLCHTLTTARSRTSYLHARWSHATHFAYQGPAAPRNRGNFGSANQRPWFESDQKVLYLIKRWLNNPKHHHPYCGGVTLQDSPDVEWHPPGIGAQLKYTAVDAVFVIYWLPEESSSGSNVPFLNFIKISALNGAINLRGLKLDFSYPFNSKFRSLARSKCQSDFNEIYKKCAQRSQVYTY